MFIHRLINVFVRVFSLHLAQRRQTWFVLLMVFIMSWSGVAVASVKNMHASMMQHTVQSMSHLSDQSPCHHMGMQITKAAHMSHDLKHADENMLHCDQQTSLHASKAVKSCQDCHQLHCQNLNTYVEHVIPQLPQQTVFSTTLDTHSDYTTQHLAGFWQEILRPPKA